MLGKGKKVWVFLGVVLGILSLPVLAQVALSYVLHIRPFSTARFSQPAWIEARAKLDSLDIDTGQMCPAGGMVNDLIDRHLDKIKPNKEAASGLLGPADWNNSDQEQRECTGWFVGMCSGFRMDYDSIVICYGQSGKFEYATHWQH